MRKKTKNTRRTKQRGGTRKTEYVKTRTKVCPVPVLPQLGLGNLDGASCWMNATLQVFLRLYFAGLVVFYDGQPDSVFKLRINESSPSQIKRRNVEMTEYRELQHALSGMFTSHHHTILNRSANANTRTACIFPSKKRDQFTKEIQHDAFEFINKLLHVEPFLSKCKLIWFTSLSDPAHPLTKSDFDNAYKQCDLVNKENDTGEIGKNSVIFERTYWVLLRVQDISGESKYSTLKECFEETYIEESLPDTYTDKEKKHFKKKIGIYQWPEVLVCCLQRYNETDNGTYEKVPHFVHVPEKFEMDGNHYLLHGVVNHHGNTPKGGHYTSDVRSPDGRWWDHYDDSAATRKDDESYDALFNNEDAYIPALANVLLETGDITEDELAEKDTDDRYILVYLKQ